MFRHADGNRDGYLTASDWEALLVERDAAADEATRHMTRADPQKTGGLALRLDVLAVSLAPIDARAATQ